jgi:RNA polymerase sigma-70 factor (ECF subfamily)
MGKPPPTRKPAVEPALRAGPTLPGLGELTGEELADRAQRGSRPAFAALVDRFGDRLLAFLQARTGSRHDAEDLVQETFLRAYDNLPRYRRQWRFSTWLFTIARRLAASHLRQHHRHPPLRLVVAEPLDPAEVLARQDEREHLWRQARELPHRQFEALWLRYVEDMPPHEIARVLGISSVHARMVLHRARRGLVRRLGGSGRGTALRGGLPGGDGHGSQGAGS